MIQTCQVKLYVETCYKCGVVFGLNEAHRKDLLRKGFTFYCPNGHGQMYSNNLEEKLKRLERSLEKEQERRWKERERREHAERSAAAYRGQVTKIKRRVKAGKCPSCKSHFSDLQSHMNEKHPDYGDSND